MKIIVGNKCRIAVFIIAVALNTLFPVVAQDVSDPVEIELVTQFRNSDTDSTDFYDDFQISPDGTHIAASFGSQLEIWELSTESLVSTISYDEGTYLGAYSWSPDGTLLATSRDELLLYIWNPFDGTLVQTFDGIDIYSNGVHALLWYEDDKIITGSFEYLLWDLTNNSVSQEIDCHPWGVFIWQSPNSEYFATLGSSTLIWICNKDFDQVISFEGYRTLTWSPDSTLVATAGIFNTLRVWHISSGEVIATSRGGDNNIISISWHSDGIRLATGHRNDEVRIWERKTPDSLWHIGTGEIAGLRQIAWLGDRLISTGTDGIQMWNVRN